jgi:RHS repeat-associated protein
MPGRTFSAGSQYRYGFNGKEKDLETTSTSTYDYGFRIYSPGLGKFLSVDPITASFPMLTPYQFASNSPIVAIDLDGLEAKIVHGIIFNNSEGVTVINPRTIEEVDNPHKLGKGTLHSYTVMYSTSRWNEKTNQTDVTGFSFEINYYEPPKYTKFGKLWRGVRNWFSSKWKERPGLVIYGSCKGCPSIGSSGEGRKIIGSIDLEGKENKELFDLLNILGGAGDPRSGTSQENIDKIPELVQKSKEAIDANTPPDAESATTILNTKPSPVNGEPINLGPGKYDEYIRDEKGNLKRSSFKSGERDTIIQSNNNSTPDTIKKQIYSTPATPKKDVKAPKT